MHFSPPVVDLRQLRLGSLNTPPFRHLQLLLFWPLFGILFLYLERFYPVSEYYPMHCRLDDMIPFCEWFLFPYLFWFIYLIGMHVYTALYDPDAFRRLMRFIILTYGIATLIYFLWPTCQQLRPESFSRTNALTRFMAAFYAFDTNTNVCPSLHVVGAWAVSFTGLHCPRLQKTSWRIFFVLSGILITLSTVFVKQHSILDLSAALLLCFIAYPLCFLKPTTAKGTP